MTFITKESKGEYLILQLNRPKVNAINLQMVEEIRSAFKDADADDAVRGVILTGFPGIFSAGLDLIELYEYDREKMRTFFQSFGLMHIELAEFSKPFICALTGHSPAGGTVIAVAADYRIMAEGEKFGIGLNEVAVNVQITHNLVKAYAFWLGHRNAYQAIMAGKLFNPAEALQAGLVDKVVPMEEVLPQAEKKMQQYLMANKDILVNTKAVLRRDWLNGLRDGSDHAMKTTEEVWWSPEVRAKMKMFKAMLQSKKAVNQ